jgi:predicted TPR repeat methyltransferase
VELLEDVMEEFGDDVEGMRVLDVGAGNGMVADELAARGADELVGIDIVPEARTAADRDRPGLYEDYLVTDLTDLPEHEEEILRARKFDCMSCVAALGFGDIPAAAFAKAVDLIETPGWLAFNIKESFLSEGDETGFARLIRELSRREIIQIQAYRRYCHRISVTGDPLHYVAVIARKLRDLPDDILSHIE